MLPLALLLGLSAQAQPPHIVLVIVDDLGYADVGYHGGSIPTPNIDRLSGEGIRLENYFSHPVCTPARASLFTGRYAHSNGFPGIHTGPSPRGLEFPTLAEELRERGYRRHFVGKWHLGHSRWRYTPVGKGWESFVGVLNAANGHYSKVLSGPEGLSQAFYDWVRAYDNGTFHPEIDDSHSTYGITREANRVLKEHSTSSSSSDNSESPLFMVVSYTAPHTPLLAEPHWIAKCAHLPNHVRRDYCGLVVGVDEALGNLTNNIKATLGDNVVIIFTTDNGGMPHAGGVNTPLRGGKNTGFQGGNRIVGWVADWTPSGKWLGRRKVWNGLMHMSDWFPTLLAMVDEEKNTIPASSVLSQSNKLPPLDGVSVRDAIKSNGASPRSEVVQTMDEFTNMISYQTGDWKIMLGHFGDDLWSTESTSYWWVRDPGNVWEKIYELLVFVLEPFSCRDILFFWHEIFHVLVHGLKDRWEGHEDLYQSPRSAFGKSIVETLHNHISSSSSSSLEEALAQLSRDHAANPNMDLYKKLPFPIALFNINKDPTETTNQAITQPDVLAKMVRLVDKHWQKRPPQHDWRETCLPIPFYPINQSICETRQSHLYPELYRKSADPTKMKCQFNLPWVTDDDTTICGSTTFKDENGVDRQSQMVNIVTHFQGTIRKVIIRTLGRFFIAVVLGIVLIRSIVRAVRLVVNPTYPRASNKPSPPTPAPTSSASGPTKPPKKGGKKKNH